MDQKPSKPVVAIYAAPHSSPSILYGLFDVLNSAGAIYHDMVVGEPGSEAMDVRIVAADSEPFRCTGGVAVEPRESVETLGRADAVIVCDMYTPIYEVPQSDPAALDWLRRMYDGGAIVCSVCSGSLMLAEAGLLDGHQATGHWAYRELFARHFPKVRFREQLALCIEGDDDRLATAGAVTAWQDLSLYVIARLCGRQLAIETAKVFLFESREAGQLPFASITRRIANGDAAIEECQTWIAGNYHIANPVQRMAERAGMNVRTFSRRFRAATGYPPMEYVQALRVEEAKQMLESTGLPVEEIAAESGYDDLASFRRVFKRRAGITPAAYRRKFQAIAPLPARARLAVG